MSCLCHSVPWFSFFVAWHCFTSLFHRWEFTFPYMSFQMRFFLSLSHFFGFHPLPFTHRTSIEIYQCQMKHRILLNHIQSFEQMSTRLKRIEMMCFFAAYATIIIRFHHSWFIENFCLDFLISFTLCNIFFWIWLSCVLEVRLDLWNEHTQKSSHKNKKNRQTNNETKERKKNETFYFKV